MKPVRSTNHEDGTVAARITLLIWLWIGDKAFFASPLGLGVFDSPYYGSSLNSQTFLLRVRTSCFLLNCTRFLCLGNSLFFSVSRWFCFVCRGLFAGFFEFWGLNFDIGTIERLFLRCSPHKCVDELILPHGVPSANTRLFGHSCKITNTLFFKARSCHVSSLGPWSGGVGISSNGLQRVHT